MVSACPATILRKHPDSTLYLDLDQPRIRTGLAPVMHNRDHGSKTELEERLRWAKQRTKQTAARL